MGGLIFLSNPMIILHPVCLSSDECSERQEIEGSRAQSTRRVTAASIGKINEGKTLFSLTFLSFIMEC